MSYTDEGPSPTDKGRATWLADRRTAVIGAYDAEAPTYDAHEYPSAPQHAWVARLLGQLTPDSLVLDAPCGTGKYFPLIAAAGHRVAGVDQSAGMLEQARARNLAVWLERVSLQELALAGPFDAVLTIDAMENVPPEEWPLVLRNLHHTLRPGGPWYMTVEEIDQAQIETAFVAQREAGLPAVLTPGLAATLRLGAPR